MKNSNKNKGYISYKAIHPSSILGKFLDSNEMTQKQLAKRMGVVSKTINEIMTKKTLISAEMALKLEKVFNVKASFWLNLNKEYEEAKIRLADKSNIEREVLIAK